MTLATEQMTRAHKWVKDQKNPNEVAGILEAALRQRVDGGKAAVALLVRLFGPSNSSGSVSFDALIVPEVIAALHAGLMRIEAPNEMLHSALCGLEGEARRLKDHRLEH